MYSHTTKQENLIIYFKSNMLIEKKSIEYILNYIERASNFPNDIWFNDVKSDVMRRVYVLFSIS